MDLLRLENASHEDWRVVRAVGQVDVATAPKLRQALVEAQYGGSTDLVIDLEGVEFLDSMGIGVLVGALKRARTHGTRLAVVCPNPRLRRLLEITDLDRPLHVVESLEALSP